MAVTPTATGIQYGSGFRYGAAFALNTAGRIAGNSSSVPYMGSTFVGGKVWNLTVPKPRELYHVNADRVGAVDYLPPLTAATGVLNVSAANQVLDAILTGNKQVQIGQSETLAYLSSNQGYEPIIALHLWQQSLDSVSRLRSWRSFMIPRAKAVPINSGMADKEVDGQYDIMCNPSSVDMFGLALSVATDGCTDAQLFEVHSTGRPAIAAWVGDGYTTDFTFPAGYTPTIDVLSVACYVQGALQVAGITVSTTKIHFTSAPAALADITVFWEF
jgi:hypothetical protein